MMYKLRKYALSTGVAFVMVAGLTANEARADLGADINSALSAGTRDQAISAVGKVASQNPDKGKDIADLVTGIITEPDAADYAVEIARACNKASNVSQCTKDVVSQFGRSFPASADQIVASVVAAGVSPEVAAAALQSLNPAAGQPLAQPGPAGVVINPGVGVDVTQPESLKSRKTTRLLQVFGFGPTSEQRSSPEEPNGNTDE